MFAIWAAAPARLVYVELARDELKHPVHVLLERHERVVEGMSASMHEHQRTRRGFVRPTTRGRGRRRSREPPLAGPRSVIVIFRSGSRRRRALTMLTPKSPPRSSYRR